MGRITGYFDTMLTDPFPGAKKVPLIDLVLFEPRYAANRRIVTALVDTGADGSSLDNELIFLLALQANSGVAQIHTAMGTEYRKDYNVVLDLSEFGLSSIEDPVLSSSFPRNSRMKMLLGWDILSQFSLHMDAKQGIVHLDL